MESPIDLHAHLTPVPLHEFGARFATFRRRAFRFESLPEYGVDEERPFLAAFLRGEACPPSFNADWLNIVGAARDRGALIERVRYVGTPPYSQYLRFEVQWGYRRSATIGESVRCLEQDALRELSRRVPILKDFWLFEDQDCYLMDYDVTGRFLGVAQVPNSALPLYVDLATEMHRASEPLTFHTFS